MFQCDYLVNRLLIKFWVGRYDHGGRGGEQCHKAYLLVTFFCSNLTEKLPVKTGASLFLSLFCKVSSRMCTLFIYIRENTLEHNFYKNEKTEIVEMISIFSRFCFLKLDLGYLRCRIILTGMQIVKVVSWIPGWSRFCFSLIIFMSLLVVLND